MVRVDEEEKVAEELGKKSKRKEKEGRRYVKMMRRIVKNP